MLSSFCVDVGIREFYTCLPFASSFMTAMNEHSCVFYGDLYPNEECYDKDIADKLRILVQARKRYAYGQTTDYFTSRNCIGFARSIDVTASKPGCVVVLSNASTSSQFVLSHAVIGITRVLI